MEQRTALPLGHRLGVRIWLQHGGVTCTSARPNLPPAHRFSVAPMMDYTDRHFRVLMRQVSRHALLYTEMVVAQALHHGRADALLGFDLDEKPIALQLGGDDPRLLAKAAELAQRWGYDEVNLNVGSPSPKVKQGRFGACLMAQPHRVAECVAAMGEACTLPITVKHRIGIDDQDSYSELLHFVDVVAAAGCQRFAVHARKAWLEGLDPKQNRTVPPLRYELVHALKQERPQLTVELNGGIETLEHCREQLSRVDGVMVGRAAYAHPLQWNQVDQQLFGDHSRNAVKASEVLRGVIPHAERWCNSGGRLWPIARHLVHLVEGVSGARYWRRQLSREASERSARPDVLERAAQQLEERGL